MYIDLRQTECYSNYVRKIGWKVDKFQDIFLYSKNILFWKFVKIQRPKNIIVKLLNSYIVKNYKHSTIYVEPFTYEQSVEFIKLGFKKYNSPFLPSKTIQVDLKKSEDELLRKMHYKTRYNINHFIHNKTLKLNKTND